MQTFQYAVVVSAGHHLHELVERRLRPPLQVFTGARSIPDQQIDLSRPVKLWIDAYNGLARLPVDRAGILGLPLPFQVEDDRGRTPGRACSLLFALKAPSYAGAEIEMNMEWATAHGATRTASTPASTL